MKRNLLYVLTAAAIVLAGCDNKIPETGTVHNSLVSEVVLDETLTAGVTLIVGNTMSLPEHITPYPVESTNTAQYYESSNEAVATVSEQGILTAVSVGTCTITVYIGTEGVNADFTVKVDPIPYIGISSMTFSAASAEYDVATGTVNMKNQLIIVSESATEDATEPINWTSSNTEVASFDDNGVLTMHKPGRITVTAAASESEVAPVSMELALYQWIEYERFPGDGDGNGDGVNDGSPRLIMDDYNALPHTDGGWEMIEFDWQGGGHLDGWASTGQRNSYRYALLDNRRIVARGGAANNLPTASNGTAFCWQRPGGDRQSRETDGVYFIIDMKVSQVVNYFRIVNISDHGDDRGVRVTKVSEIRGSNDNSSWTTIATGLEGFNPRSTETHESGTVYPIESEKALFENTTPYRYIMFRLNKADRCYGYFASADATDQDRTGNAMQVAELYMGVKSYGD